jgi:hypothetical protein
MFIMKGTMHDSLYPAVSFLDSTFILYLSIAISLPSTPMVMLNLKQARLAELPNQEVE